MDIRIVGKHIEITDEIKSRIEDKIEDLAKFYNNSIIDVEVIVEGNKDKLVASVEIIARARHNHIFISKQTGQDVNICVDEAIKKVERQITKQKEKERNNKHSGGIA